MWLIWLVLFQDDNVGAESHPDSAGEAGNGGDGANKGTGWKSESSYKFFAGVKCDGPGGTPEIPCLRGGGLVFKKAL